MSIKFISHLIDLQLFAEGGGTGDGGAPGVTGEAAAPQGKGAKNPLADVQYGIQQDAQAASVQGTDVVEGTPDRAAEFEKLIKGEYKDKSYNLSQGISDNSPIWDECAPSIGSYRHLNDKMSVAEYNALNEQYLNDEDYLSLVKTNLTLENCSMLTSGLFSIGIEGHFAGPALDGGRWNSWDFYAQGWRELAGTAYPVQLNLKGKVSIYDWKVLENIDSSSLMEGNLFDIDMSNMIKSVGQKDEFSDIITKVDNQNYVHSGIAVFGGGKNYGIISMDGQIEEFANYSISLQDIGSSLTKMMTYASGKESFRFLLYNKNSHFTYGQQQLEISNGTAYSKIGKYIY